PVRAAGQRPFNPAVLISQGDLQVKDHFTMTLETEMPRLDDAGMYRTDRNLMHFRALQLVVLTHPGQDDVVLCSSPGIMPATTGPLIADRLEPWVVFDRDTALLGNLPFEQMSRGTGGRDAGQALLGP